MIRLVLIQFSFSNGEVIPRSVKRLSPETRKEMTNRVNGNGHATGELIIPPTLRCGLADFPSNLKENGFELVEAFYQKRIDPKDARKTYHMVRFVFAPGEFAKPSKEFTAIREEIVPGFEKICQDAMWRVKVYENPFYGEGIEEENSGYEALSINLSLREPYSSNGRPVVERPRDASGRRVGKPVPIRPEFLIQFTDGNFEWGELISQSQEVEVK